jgi:hypothetical protein
MEDSNTINSVKVLSIDEEKRKFRVIFSTNSAAAVDNRHGKFKFNLEAPTFIANSDQYKSATIKVESVGIVPDRGDTDVSWTIALAGGQDINIPGVIVRINTPSSQVVHNKTFLQADYDVGINDHNGFMQFVPLQVVNTGSLLANAAGPAGAGVPQRQQIAWIGDGSGAEPVVCGNPFNQNIELSLLAPNLDFTTCYLASPTGAGGLLNQVGTYLIQFVVEFIPNK